MAGGGILETVSKKNAANDYQWFIEESGARREKLNKIALEIYELIKGNQITYEDFLEVNTLIRGLVETRTII